MTNNPSKIKDLEKAGLSAADKLGYALTDLATSGIDLGAKVIGQETQLNERIRDVYEENKMAEPETLTGKVTEEFDCINIDVIKMKRLPIVEDPRYADSRTLSNERST